MAEVATYGWDTVYAIHVDDANAAIAASKSWPPTFEATTVGVTVNGTFGPWSIDGGSGDRVMIRAPIPSMTIVKDGQPTTLTDAAARFEIGLAYVPGDPVDQATPHALKADAPGAAAAAAAGTLSVDLDAPGLSILKKAAAEGALRAWVGASLASFEHVFTTVNVAERAADGAFGWMVPTYVDYALSGDDGEGPTLLAVLCQTGGSSADGLTPVLSSGAVPSDGRAGFMISTARFLDQLVRPSLQYAFNGMAPSDMVVRDDGLGMSLEAPVWLIPARPTHQPPQLVSLDIVVLDDILQVTSETKVEIQAGIFAHCRHQMGYKFQLANRSDGTQTLEAVNDPGTTDDVQQWTEKDDQEITLAQEILDACAVIIGIALAVVTDGASLVVATAILGLLTGLPPALRDLQTAQHGDDAPALDFLTLNATRPITWPNSSGLTLTSATLTGAFRLGGNPRPVV